MLQRQGYVHLYEWVFVWVKNITCHHFLSFTIISFENFTNWKKERWFQCCHRRESRHYLFLSWSKFIYTYETCNIRIRRSPKSIASFEDETTWTDAHKRASTKNFNVRPHTHWWWGQSTIPTNRVKLLKHFRAMATTGRIHPVTCSFADAQGNFALPDHFARDDSLWFHLRNELTYLRKVGNMS